MESSTTLAYQPGNSQAVNLAVQQVNLEKGKDKLVIDQISRKEGRDQAVSVSVSKDGSLVITANEIVAALNEELAAELPGGIESLKPEDVTPDATSDFIVNGIMGMFDAYSKSNPELSDEEKIDRFFSSAREGVQQGYKDAMEILEALGALEFDGVAEGIEKTMQMVEDKLNKFETAKRVELGLLEGKVEELPTLPPTQESNHSGGVNVSA